LGAKLFDLLVVAGALECRAPTSFALLPYGPRFPIDPGNFFQPPSAVMALGILGAVISGWRAPVQLRFWFVAGLDHVSHHLGDHTYGLLADDPPVIWHRNRPGHGYGPQNLSR